MKHYDVIIVGAGPAGIFSALELIRGNPEIEVLLIEKGRDIEDRICPAMNNNSTCEQCNECNLLCGWGGAGAFSDGKLSLTKDIGGNLSRYINDTELDDLISYTDSIYLEFGAPEKIYGDDHSKIVNLRKRAHEIGLTLIPSRIRHIGTDKCPEILKRLRSFLNSKIEVLFSRDVRKILADNEKVTGVEVNNGERFYGDFVVVAPGREGALWLERQAKRLGLSLLKNPVDNGVRVELKAEVLEPLTESTYEPKLIYMTKKFNDRIRTFCVNPHGEVVREYVKGVWIVNGHSYSSKTTDNTNFALLVSTHFTEPFNEPHLYGRHIARLANLLGRGVIIQRLGDLKAGRRSTYQRILEGSVRPTLKDATPGDLSFALPHRYISDILEMLEVMDKIAPGVNDDHTLLYGIEVKFYSRQIKLTRNLETELRNLFAVGDGAGVSRGLIQASASGILAAREILKRIIM